MSLVEINVYIDGKKQTGKKPKVTLRWGIGPVSEQPHNGTRSLTYMLQLTNTQQCQLSIAGVDKKGNPAGLEGIIYSSSDPSVAAVTQDAADPSKALVVAVAAGTAQINVRADADLGDGVTELTGVLDVTVVPGQAVSFVINTGTPEEQP